MNISSVIGLFLGFGVLLKALNGTTDNLMFFLDVHGILIVCGGTAAASSIAYPIKDVLLLLKVFFVRVLGKGYLNYQDLINEFLEINKQISTGDISSNPTFRFVQHPFLKEAVGMVVSGVLTEQEIEKVLILRLKTLEKRYIYEANMFRNIGRFPPAFGLLATTLGMISLLQKIGQPDSQKLIGPAMSVGLIGTLYGITLANLVFIPISENLAERTYEEIVFRKMIIQGALLLKSKANSIVFREQLNSYLLPKQRLVRINKSSNKRASA